MPRLLRVGFAVVAAGLVADVAYHAAGAGGAAGELAGHVLSLAGMLVVLAGVFTTAVRTRACRPIDGVRHDPR